MKKLMGFFSGFAGILLFIFFIFVVFDVFFRSVLQIPIVWLNEGSVYLFMWMAFISGGLAFFYDTHYKLNLFSEKFEKKIDFLLTILEAISVMVFAGILIWQGIQFVLYSTMKYSPALGMNMGFITSVLPLCGIICFLGIVYRFWTMWKAHKLGLKHKGGEKE